MTEQVDYAELTARVANTVMALGPGMFDVLESLSLHARIVLVAAIKKETNMPATVALELIRAPLEIKAAIGSNPGLSILLLLSAMGRQKYLTPEARRRLSADMELLIEQKSSRAQNGPEV
jgi:hypothetical protein